MAHVLEVYDLEKNFGGVVAAHNINVTVDEAKRSALSAPTAPARRRS